MEVKKIGKTGGGQDGTIFKNYMFRFSKNGVCRVYDMNAKEGKEPFSFISEFDLDMKESICPHSNAVVFGTEYFSPSDEFPLLYSNIYNNYSSSPNPMKGTLLVYRIKREEEVFSSELIQIIEVGFANDSRLWISDGEKADMRPYGNFVIDKERNLLWTYTMLDKPYLSRYFAFKLPKSSEGELDHCYGVKRRILEREEILDSFDTDYHHFVQGGCLHNGKVYSVEGFTDSKENPPGIRVVNTIEKKQEFYADFRDFGLMIEPEFIEFKEDICFYSDGKGNIYELSF